ncbi:MAG: CorA family divalent cation transporter [Sulfuricurvum sp.]|uniref:CorA family divalent cation transporter n=1 Tax=Sulfuricurvum sp. TaxID=2025608 RepID=UPI0026340AA0|nr:CorA family divalent cation transporter [Sulfuricurvum sp.]MDD5161262.1 CorA family divalent cation transporter [Sulfuricurvum sp.]
MMVELHELHLKDLQNPIHPSLYEAFGSYQILILRLPELWEGKANILALRSNEYWKTKGRFFSYAFVIVDKEVYLYHRKSEELTLFENGFKDLYLFLDEKIDAFMDDLEIAHDKIAFIEESLYKKQSFNPMDRWHILKKELSRTERVVIKAVDTFERFVSKSDLSKSNLLNEFNDLHEHLERSLRSTVAANDQLDDIYRYHNIRTNDRLNRSIYLLTIISVIFLPLNLVVGFFGMNTGGLPFQHTMGTLDAFVSMIVFAALLTIGVLWKIKKE